MENFKKANHIYKEFVIFMVLQYIGKQGGDATDKILGKFNNFNDPTEYKKQLGQLIFNMIDVAIDGMKEVRIPDIATKLVWTHMTKQATNFQGDFLPLNAIIFWEIALLARHSERKNDVDFFCLC
jgi:hypothetical protein